MIHSSNCFCRQDARWYTRSEILTVLNHPDGTNITRSDHKKMGNIIDGNKQVDTQPNPETKRDGPPFRVPPTTAIAGVLIRDWADGKLSFFTQADQKVASNL